MSAEDGTNTLTIELPEDALTGVAGTPRAFAREVRQAAAIEWYREGLILQGKGGSHRGREPGRVPRRPVLGESARVPDDSR